MGSKSFQQRQLLTLFGVGLALALVVGCSWHAPVRLLNAPGRPMVWWPASGLALALLVRCRKSWWLPLVAAIASALFITGLAGGQSVAACACRVLADTAEALVAAQLLRGSRPAHLLLRSSADVPRFFGSLLAGSAVAAAILSWGLVRQFAPAGATSMTILRATLLSHTLGMIVFTPLILVPLRSELSEWLGNRRRLAEAITLLGGGAAVSYYVFERTVGVPLGSVVVLILIWGAFRLPPLGSMLAVALTTLISILGTLQGRGPYMVLTSANQRELVLQVSLVCTSSAILAVVLSISDRNRQLDSLIRREAALTAAQHQAGMGDYYWDLASDALTWSPEVYQITGFDPATFTPTLAAFAKLIHPHDHAAMAATVQQALGSGLTDYELEYRFFRPDGEMRILRNRAQVTTDRGGQLIGITGITQDVTEQRRAEAELADARDLYAGVLDAATEQAIIGTDLSGVVTVFNIGAQRMLGYTAEEVLGGSSMKWHLMSEVIRRAEILGIPAGPAAVTHALTGDTHAETRQWTFVTKQGKHLQVLLALTVMHNGRGEPVGYIGVGTDATEQRDAIFALADSEERFRLAFDTAPVGMGMVDLSPESAGRLLRANQALCEFTGLPVADLLHQSLTDLCSPNDVDELRASLAALASGDTKTVHAVHEFERSEGGAVWGRLSMSTVQPSDGRKPYGICLVEDITARRQAELALVHQSLHDPLTGLANRALLHDRITHALAACARSGRAVGVLFIDLDGFKLVNDSAGHAVGDEVLNQTARRLQQVVRPGDTVARLGGDEFAIVCVDINEPDDLRVVANRALVALQSPFHIAGAAHQVSASIGMSLSDDSTGAERLLEIADAAMYSAKRAGKNRVAVSSLAEHARAARTARLGPELRDALDFNQLVMHGQPVLDLGSGRVVAVETLMRWRHPVRGILPPSEFLDVAEQSPVMIELGQRALAESCRMAANWIEILGSEAPDVHVNVSGRQLESGALITDVLQALATYQLPANKLILELTETHMPAITAGLRADLNRLRDRGVRIAIDDLGTGYSSLTRITELPVDILKIDIKFVAGLGVEASCDAVVRAVLGLGQAMGLMVVAEGVETPYQAELLASYGCDTVQGYLYSPPRPETELSRLLLGKAAQRHAS